MCGLLLLFPRIKGTIFYANSIFLIFLPVVAFFFSLYIEREPVYVFRASHTHVISNCVTCLSVSCARINMAQSRKCCNSSNFFFFFSSLSLCSFHHEYDVFLLLFCNNIAFVNYIFHEKTKLFFKDNSSMCVCVCVFGGHKRSDYIDASSLASREREREESHTQGSAFHGDVAFGKARERAHKTCRHATTMRRTHAYMVCAYQARYYNIITIPYGSTHFETPHNIICTELFYKV